MSWQRAIAGIDLLERFDTLLDRVTALAGAVRRETRLPAWVALDAPRTEDAGGMRARAAELYGALWYRDGQDGRDTVTGPGLVGAGPETLALAGACNDAKDAFKTAVQALKALPQPTRAAAMEAVHTRHDEVAQALGRLGAARLNLKQAYRHVPVLPLRPVKVGFTWSRRGRTIQRTTPEEARAMLESRGDSAQTRLELGRLATLPPGEMLARVRRVCPHLRANVLFPVPVDGAVRRLVQAPLPLLVPLAPGEALPQFVPVAPVPGDGQRLRRSDVRIEDEPFLPSLHAHRYRPAHRE